MGLLTSSKSQQCWDITYTPIVLLKGPAISKHIYLQRHCFLFKCQALQFKVSGATALASLNPRLRCRPIVQSDYFTYFSGHQNICYTVRKTCACKGYVSGVLLPDRDGRHRLSLDRNYHSAQQSCTLKFHLCQGIQGWWPFQSSFEYISSWATAI